MDQDLQALSGFYTRTINESDPTPTKPLYHDRIRERQRRTNTLRASYGRVVASWANQESTPGSSPSTAGTTSPSTLTFRERSSYLTSRDWLVVESGPPSS